jgi:predicted glycogen debranching enzyme
LKFDLSGDKCANIIASTEPHEISKADEYLNNELARRNKPDKTLAETLTRAADQFLVSRGNGKTLIAGYHWFSDWGRDTMIALPGLLLTTGKYEIAKSVLAEFVKHVDRGMLPNRFPDAGENPEYNTVDATLWLFEAVRALLDHVDEFTFVREQLYDVLKDIINWHLKGTRYNIHVDSDGLLFSGEPGVQLTWMDAKVGNQVITPRYGKPVEIQALWYNALRVMEGLAEEFEDYSSQTSFEQMAGQALRSFNEKFWNENASCLFDVVNGEVRDSSIRPNQIIAVSLKHSMLPRDRAERLLRTVDRHLLTPRGLRTLSPSDAQYCGRYEGDGVSRDSAYHQGTVWPWLMGPYFSGYARVFGPKAVKEFGSQWLSGFEEHLTETCLGQISEIFDGDAPHAPKGCAAQAWSVSEILRAATECIWSSPRALQTVSMLSANQ